MNSNKKPEAKVNKISPFYILGKASEISFNLVFLPITLLFLGLIIDKRLNTTPIFIVTGSLLGFSIAVGKALKIKNQIYKK